jgi:hypothetical protein
MHTAITAHAQFLDADNLDLLDGATFVFRASKDAASKPAMIDRLEAADIAFIDVGIGVEETDGKLAGLARQVTSTPAHRDHARNRIPAPAPGVDDYGRNIENADLNALGAILAVVRFRRHLGYYADLTTEGLSTYSIATNEMSNEDRPETAP